MEYSNVEYVRKELEILEDWREWIAKLKKAIVKRLPDAKVCVLVSVVECRYTAASDIDVLVIYRYIPRSAIERADIVVFVEDEPWSCTAKPIPISTTSSNT